MAVGVIGIIGAVVEVDIKANGAAVTTIGATTDITQNFIAMVFQRASNQMKTHKVKASISKAMETRFGKDNQAGKKIAAEVGDRD